MKINRKEINSVYRDFVDTLWDTKEYIVQEKGALASFMQEQLKGLQLLADTVGDEVPEENNP